MQKSLLIIIALLTWISFALSEEKEPITIKDFRLLIDAKVDKKIIFNLMKERKVAGKPEDVQLMLKTLEGMGISDMDIPDIPIIHNYKSELQKLKEWVKKKIKNHKHPHNHPKHEHPHTHSLPEHEHPHNHPHSHRHLEERIKYLEELIDAPPIKDANPLVYKRRVTLKPGEHHDFNNIEGYFFISSGGFIRGAVAVVEGRGKCRFIYKGEPVLPGEKIEWSDIDKPGAFCLLRIDNAPYYPIRIKNNHTQKFTFTVTVLR